MQLPADILSYPENPPTFDEVFAAWRARKTESMTRARESPIRVGSDDAI